VTINRVVVGIGHWSKQFVAGVLLVCLGAGLVGCITGTPKTKKEMIAQHDTDAVDQYTVTSDHIIWLDKDHKYSTFNGVRIEPLQIRVSSSDINSQGRALARRPNQVAYERMMKKVLEPRYGSALNEEPVVLRVRALLTTRVVDRQILSKADRFGIDQNGFLDGVALLVRFYDDNTGKLVAIMVSREQGHIFEANLLHPGSEVQLEESFEPFALSLGRALDKRRALEVAHAQAAAQADPQGATE
jgi:hypothetical protein